ncbi:MAG: XdhC family protein [Bacteroidales bacterium]|nr:XdhC family protein [Bacteroidales bacterium]
MEDIYKKVWKLRRSGKDGVLVTVVSKEGEGPVLAGNKMLVYADGSSTGTVGGGNLEYLAIKKAKEVMQSGKNSLEHYNLSSDEGEGTKTGMACGGQATLFFEALVQQKRVYIFGAGHIGKALFELLGKLDLNVTIVDDRREMIDALTQEGEKIHSGFSSYMDDTAFSREPYFLLATYQHKHDSTILNKIFQLNIKTPYIGIVASKNTREELLETLKKETGENPDLSNVYSPVGLDIGGTDNPWEIALSIAAEIQAIRYGKETNHLRDKK